MSVDKEDIALRGLGREIFYPDMPRRKTYEQPQTISSKLRSLFLKK